MNFDQQGFTVVADRGYGKRRNLKLQSMSQAKPSLEAGEEVLVSYGSHSNDFLWVECMFTCLSSF